MAIHSQTSPHLFYRRSGRRRGGICLTLDSVCFKWKLFFWAVSGEERGGGHISLFEIDSKIVFCNLDGRGGRFHLR